MNTSYSIANRGTETVAGTTYLRYIAWSVTYTDGALTSTGAGEFRFPAGMDVIASDVNDENLESYISEVLGSEYISDMLNFHSDAISHKAYVKSLTLDKPLAEDRVDFISMRQCRLQLLADGLLDTVNSQVSAMDQASQIAWEYATTVDRNDALAGAMQVILGLSDADVDAMFVAASKL